MSIARAANVRTSKKVGEAKSTRASAIKTKPLKAKFARDDVPPVLTIFLSYSHKDEIHLERLRKHLRPLERKGIELWYDRDIEAGGELAPEIKRALRRARIFVGVISPDYIASTYCFEKEYRYALGRRERKTMHVVAAVIRTCGWLGTPMARFKSLPRDGRPANEWPSRDKAYEDIAHGIAGVVRSELTQCAVTGPEIGRVGPAPTKKPRLPSKKTAPTSKPSAISTRSGKRRSPSNAKTGPRR